MEIKDNFDEVYEKILNEFDDEFQKARIEAEKEEKKNSIINKVIYIITIIITLYLSYMEFSEFESPNWYEIIVGVVVLLFIMSADIIITAIIGAFIFHSGETPKKDKYVKEFKKRIDSILIDSINSGLKFDSEKGILQETYQEAEFENAKNFDVYASGNFVSGNLSNNSKIIMSELFTDKSIRENTEPSISVTFEGLFAKIEMPKFSPVSLYLRKKTKNKEIEKLRNISFDKLKMDENYLPEFKETFDVYTSNEIYLKEILTNEVMKELVECYNEMNYELTIKDNYLYLKLWCGEHLFEIPNLKKFKLNKSSLHKRYSKLEKVFEIIEKLMKIFDN